MIPDLVFIIPYRDREEHKNIFDIYIKEYLKIINENNYKIFYICQNDNRSFNRGAMKNFGFLYVRHLYPNDYKNITLVFHDIDTLPTKNSNIKYQTTHGTVAHFYGKEFALGGIFSIKAGDFEKVKGFPNFWFWGFEDNIIQMRCIKENLMCNREVYYDIKQNYDENFKYVIRLDQKDLPIKTISQIEINRCFNLDVDNFDDLKNVDTYVNGNNVIINYFECGFDYNESVKGKVKIDLTNTNIIKADYRYFRKKWSLSLN